MDCVCGQKLLLCGKTPGHLCVKHEHYGQKTIKSGYGPKLCLQKWCRYLNNCSSPNPEWKNECSSWFYHLINVYVCIHRPGVDLYWWVWAEWVSGHLHLSMQTNPPPASFHSHERQIFFKPCKPHSWKVGWMHPNHEHHPVIRTACVTVFSLSLLCRFCNSSVLSRSLEHQTSWWEGHKWWRKCG